MSAHERAPAGWSALLIDAVTKPGVISQAYSRFWNYSIGNQLLALWQCAQRGIEPGPINTFLAWKELGRNVKRGQRALTLCMPVSVKAKRKSPEEVLSAHPARVGDGAERQVTGPGGIVPKQEPERITVFAYKPHWFVLSQTEGADYVPTEVPEWSEAQALHTLAIDRVTFTHGNGNCQGYASGRTVAVSPIAFLPHKTLFHELAHVLLGHIEEGNTLDDHDLTPPEPPGSRGRVRRPHLLRGIEPPRNPRMQGIPPALAGEGDDPGTVRPEDLPGRRPAPPLRTTGNERSGPCLTSSISAPSSSPRLH